jgi:hypothetical protein
LKQAVILKNAGGWGTIEAERATGEIDKRTLAGQVLRSAQDDKG